MLLTSAPSLNGRSRRHHREVLPATDISTRFIGTSVECGAETSRRDSVWQWQTRIQGPFTLRREARTRRDLGALGRAGGLALKCRVCTSFDPIRRRPTQDLRSESPRGMSRKTQTRNTIRPSARLVSWASGYKLCRGQCGAPQTHDLLPASDAKLNPGTAGHHIRTSTLCKPARRPAEGRGPATPNPGTAIGPFASYGRISREEVKQKITYQLSICPRLAAQGV